MFSFVMVLDFVSAVKDVESLMIVKVSREFFDAVFKSLLRHMRYGA